MEESEYSEYLSADDEFPPPAPSPPEICYTPEEEQSPEQSPERQSPVRQSPRRQSPARSPGRRSIGTVDRTTTPYNDIMFIYE